MAEDIKTWMIEPGDVLDVMPPQEKQPDIARAQTVRPMSTHRVINPVRPEVIKRSVAPPKLEKSKMQFARLALLTYLLGPLSIMLTPRGRQQKKTVAVGLTSVLATAVLLTVKFSGLVKAELSFSVWAWFVLLAVALVGGFSVWARALFMIGREGIPHKSKMPAWLGHSWVISGLGLLAPGSGFLISGRADRAAIVMWLMWPAIAAVVILSHALGLWQHHQTSGWLASSGVALEKTFVVACAVTAVGFLGYLAQALEGMREVLAAPHLKAGARRNIYAVGALSLVLIVVVMASPVPLARQMGAGSEMLRAEGMQTIPLRLSVMASNLDPASVTYAMQAVALYDALGDEANAAVLRAELAENLGSYVAMVQKETVVESGRVQADKSQTDELQTDELQVNPQMSLTAESFLGVMIQPNPAPPTDEEIPLRKRVTQALGLP